MNQDKRQRIMQAAEQVFRNCRVNEVTLDEIAKVADVGKGTIYLYFADKEDLIFQAAVAGFEEMCQVLRQSTAETGTTRERLLRASDQMVTFFQARRPLFRIILSEGERAMEGGNVGLRERWRERRRLMTEAVAALIAQGVAAGEIHSALPAEVLAEYFMGMLRTRSWELEGWPEAERSHVATVDLFLNGVGAAARVPSSIPLQTT
jgi:TetR/AcrR family transcriptional regulator, fatty acid metabolism regulator protein